MKVTFWGVRGCIPAPGPETNRYGGNTACITVESSSGDLLILDAGTGVIVLGRFLMKGPFGRGQGKAAMLLTHSHWDHIQGFPFFAPVYVSGNQFEIHGQGSSSARLEDILEGQMSPHFNPVQSIRNLGATIVFRDVVATEPFQVGSLTIRGLEVGHGATKILSFRVEEGDSSVVYAPDVAYEENGIPEAVLKHYAGAGLLVHDSTYLDEDWAERKNRGLSCSRLAARAAVEAGVEALAPFHYDQDYDDETVDVLLEQIRGHLDAFGGDKIRLVPAREGLSVVV